MREIKFRAWDKIHDKMVDWDLIIKHCDRFSLLNDKNYIFMQYTGLQDKNDKDIYEGDILSPNNREVLWKSNTRIGTVFDCAGWYTRAYKTTMRPEELGCFTFGITQAEVSEVVGNLYEHPELLNHPPKKEE